MTIATPVGLCPLLVLSRYVAIISASSALDLAPVVSSRYLLDAALSSMGAQLLAFGIDSLIELVSAGILLWRLNVELRRGEVFAEDAERKATRIGTVLLFALAIYVVISAGWKLWTGQGGEFSLLGLT